MGGYFVRTALVAGLTAWFVVIGTVPSAHVVDEPFVGFSLPVEQSTRAPFSQGDVRLAARAPAPAPTLDTLLAADGVSELAPLPAAEAPARAAWLVPDREHTLGCPFVPAPGRIIIDLTEGSTARLEDRPLVAHRTASEAQSSQAVTFGPGQYVIRVATLDHDDGDRRIELDERWYVAFFDQAGTEIVRTKPTRDLELSERVVLEQLERSLTISRQVSMVRVVHDAFPGKEPNALLPLCVALDQVRSPVLALASSLVPAQEPSVTCPIPKRENRTIVDLTKGGTVPLAELFIRSDGAEQDAMLPAAPLYLQPGSYEVRFAAHAAEGVRTDGERWRAVLYDLSGQRQELEVTRDIPDWEQTFVTKGSDEVLIAQPIVRFAPVHARYPDADAHALAVLCASFDRLGIETRPTVAADDGAMSAVLPETHQDADSTALAQTDESSMNGTDLSTLEPAQDGDEQPQESGPRTPLAVVAMTFLALVILGLLWLGGLGSPRST